MDTTQPSGAFAVQPADQSEEDAKNIMRFHGNSKRQEKITLEEAKDKTTERLAFSAHLSRSGSLRDAMRR